MLYLALIYFDEDVEQTPEGFAEYRALAQSLTEAGELAGAHPLEHSSTATCVRVREGDVALLDGPYAETKEALGGYFLLECPDLDRALELAARIPHARTGTIEVRPVMSHA